MLNAWLVSDAKIIEQRTVLTLISSRVLEIISEMHKLAAVKDPPTSQWEHQSHKCDQDLC